MVSASKNKKTYRSKSVRLSDERFRKITGIMLILVSIYLLISFTSYFVSWKADQDKVLRFSTDMLFNSDISVNNWLGRSWSSCFQRIHLLGFWHSIASFRAVFFRMGFVILFRKNINRFLVFLTNCLYLIAFSSIILGYFFSKSEFSWGGAFGTSVNQWMVNFIGSVGFLLLLIFTFFGVLIWFFNPKFETMKFSTGSLNLNFPVLFLRNRFKGGTLADSKNSKDGSGEDNSEVGISDSNDDSLPSAIDFELGRSKIEVDPVEIDNTEFDINYPSNEEGIEKLRVTGSGESIDLVSKDDFDTIKVISDNEDEIFIEPYDPLKGIVKL